MLKTSPDSKETLTPALSRSTGRGGGVLAVLMLLFIGSGCAALIYEIVWFQLLQLVIGSSAVSLGVLLGTFMGGMCLGSIVLPQIISPRRHPLRVYAFLEMGIGVLGLAVLFGMPYVDRLYVQAVGHGMGSVLLRGGVCALCLLPPTLLMGATLPAIARWVKTTPQGVSWLGFFYGGNIVGAVIGCLLAGFYLLRVYDMPTATYVAAALNVAVAVPALLLAKMTSYEPPPVAPRADKSSRTPGAVHAYVAIALSGMTALACEVIWTRLLSLMLGATVYTFSIILAVFLMGLGIGSSVGAFLARTTPRPAVVLGVCQLLLAAALTWAASALCRALPYWPVDPSMSPAPWYVFEFDLLRSACVVLPGAILWGASFPLALAAVARPGQDPGRVVGRLYAANTVGAIVGALGASLLLVQAVGSQHAHQILIFICAMSALVMLLRELSPAAGTLVMAGVAVCCTVLALLVPPVPGLLIAYGRYLPSRRPVMRDGQVVDKEATVLFAEEGLNASVAVTKLQNGVRSFHISGRIEASTEPQDMRLQRMLGHIPAMLHPQPKSVLIVGCGAGVTAGTFMLYPDVDRIVICEIEPLIPEVVATHFAEQNYNVVHPASRPRVQIIYDDARHYILTTDEKFDIITSDPIHPWIKGSATLYSKEYFELVRKHLKPGGLVTQWLPLYESTPEVVKSEVATFLEAFPNGTIWGNDIDGSGYDAVMLGSESEMAIDVDRIQDRVADVNYTRVAASLRQVGFVNGIDLLATYAGQKSDLTDWLADAQINRDRNLRLQYLAGMGLNTYQSGGIYQEMVSRRRFPEKLFTGSDRRMQTLRFAIEGPQTKQ
jgi:spermidine synthase